MRLFNALFIATVWTLLFTSSSLTYADGGVVGTGGGGGLQSGYLNFPTGYDTPSHPLETGSRRKCREGAWSIEYTHDIYNEFSGPVAVPVQCHEGHWIRQD